MLDDHGADDQTGRLVAGTLDRIVEFGIVPLLYLCLGEKVAKHHPAVALVQLLQGVAEQIQAQLLFL